LQEFTKGITGEMITWKAESVGVVTMTKKGHYLLRMMTKKVVSFLGKNRVTPSVAAPGGSGVLVVS